MKKEILICKDIPKFVPDVMKQWNVDNCNLKISMDFGQKFCNTQLSIGLKLAKLEIKLLCCYVDSTKLLNRTTKSFKRWLDKLLASSGFVKMRDCIPIWRPFALLELFKFLLLFLSNKKKHHWSRQPAVGGTESIWNILSQRLSCKKKLKAVVLHWSWTLSLPEQQFDKRRLPIKWERAQL